MAHIRGPINTNKGVAHDVCWRDPDGRFRQERVYGGIRKAEARAKAIDASKHDGRYFDDRAGRRTFAEVAEEWLATLTRPRPETIDGYSKLLHLHIYPYFADRKLNTIKPGDMGKWINTLKVKPRGNRPDSTLHPDTIKRTAGVAASVFKYAVAQGLILKSPMDGVQLPTEETLGLEPFSGRALSLPEVAAIASAAGDVHPVYGLLVRFLAATGLRASELSGLRISDVSADSVRVARTATRDSRVPGGIRYGVPKSRTSRRTVPILDSAVARDLAEYITTLPAATSNPNTPVFPERLRGSKTRWVWDRPIDPGNFRRRVFDPACREAGIGKIRLHDLRHTAGSLWLAAGVSLFNTSRYLGHSSVDFTARVYGHVHETSARDDAARFAAFANADNVIPLRAAR